MKKLHKIGILKFKLSASKKLAKIGGSSEHLEPLWLQACNCTDYMHVCIKCIVKTIIVYVVTCSP